MKIGFLAPHIKIAGGTRIFLEYAARLSSRGHEVTVYVVNKKPLRRIVANLLCVKPRWIKNFHAQVSRVLEFSSDAIARSDVLIATTHNTAMALSQFPLSSGRQFYLLQHDEGLYHGDRTLVDEAYHLPQRKIVVATWLREMLSEKYGQDADTLINPIDLNQFHAVPRTATDGTVRILVLAHTYAWKGTREAVDMVNALKGEHPEVRLVLYGVRIEDASGYACDEYHYNLPQDELRQLYSNADIFLCTSWDEGFGLPSLEAMACGSAVATYDNGGSRDFAFHEKTALVAPRRDALVLARELERLIVDKDLRSDIAAEGMNFVKKMATWDAQTDELERIIGIRKS